jgi:hypothetical protein
VYPSVDGNLYILPREPPCPKSSVLRLVIVVLHRVSRHCVCITLIRAQHLISQHAHHDTLQDQTQERTTRSKPSRTAQGAVSAVLPKCGLVSLRAIRSGGWSSKSTIGVKGDAGCAYLFISAAQPASRSRSRGSSPSTLLSLVASQLLVQMRLRPRGRRP